MKAGSLTLFEEVHIHFFKAWGIEDFVKRARTRLGADEAVPIL